MVPPERDPAEMRADAERLADIIAAIQRRFVLSLSKELGRGNVSFPQYLLLGFLSQSELMMTEIARRMGHTTAAATGLIDRLERLGLAERTHDPEDRRKIVVRITSAGLDLVGRIRADIVENVLRVMEALTPQEQVMWLQIYEKIIAICLQK